MSVIAIVLAINETTTPLLKKFLSL